MQHELQIIDGIHDILPPPIPPDPTNLILIAIFSLFTLFILSVLVWHYRYSRRGSAKQQLKALQCLLTEKKIESSDAAFRLSSILRTALGITHIGIDSPLPEKILHYDSRWREFVIKMSLARYTYKYPSTQDLACLVRDARFWLKVWPH